jgi:type IV secretory pathway VirB2 component (pilin)
MTDTTPRTLPRYLTVGAVFALAFALLPHVAAASSAGGGAPMPWTGPLQSLLDNLSGPTARIIGALAFVVGGALWAFTRHEEGARRFAQAIVGLAIMIGAANIVSALAFVGATV